MRPCFTSFWWALRSRASRLLCAAVVACIHLPSWPHGRQHSMSRNWRLVVSLFSSQGPPQGANFMARTHSPRRPRARNRRTGEPLSDPSATHLGPKVEPPGGRLTTESHRQSGWRRVVVVRSDLPRRKQIRAWLRSFPSPDTSGAPRVRDVVSLPTESVQFPGANEGKAVGPPSGRGCCTRPGLPPIRES